MGRCLSGRGGGSLVDGVGGWWPWWFGLYKILFYFEAFVHESIIRLLPPPTCIARTIAILLYCTSIAQLTTPTDRPLECHTSYNIGDDNIV